MWICGTLRVNRQRVPVALKTKAPKLKQDEIIYQSIYQHNTIPHAGRIIKTNPQFFF